MNCWPSRYWADYTSLDLAGLPRARLIAVLPLGATEQHGPHLPIGTDTAIVDGIVAAAIEKLPDELPVLFLPTLAYGKSNEHARFAGTVTLPVDVLLPLWTAIAESVVRAGVRKFVLFNAHGGQMNAMDIAVRDIRERFGILAVSAHWYTLGLPPGMVDAHEAQHGIHGGALETSLLLALAPEKVRMDRAQRFGSLTEALARENRFLSITTSGKIGWQMQDLNPQGAAGDATQASAEKGRAIVEHVSGRFIELLQEVDRFDLARLGNDPAWG
ncbi:MAG: creatininase family protein [Burkholderiales bacterium]|nr:creatininase family protein [Burkholderiales bacterium]